MTLSNLKEFIDLAYTLNFGASAARMFISQSTLSKHISSTEDELGCPLFIHSKQSVRLTEAGKTFCEQIKPLVTQYDDAVRQLQNAQQTLTGTLRSLPPNSSSPPCGSFSAAIPTCGLTLSATR